MLDAMYAQSMSWEFNFELKLTDSKGMSFVQPDLLMVLSFVKKNS